MTSGSKAVYHVSLVAHVLGLDTIGAVAESDGYDPNPANNVAIVTIIIIPESE